MATGYDIKIHLVLSNSKTRLKFVMNMEIPYDLKTAILQDNLVIFVGAGLSRSVGHPTWNQLIEDMLKKNSQRIPNAQTYIETLSTGILGPLEILEKLKDNHKKIIYEHFEETLHHVQNSSLHKKLSKLSKKIITTNYDKIIEGNTTAPIIIDNTSDYNLSKLDTLDCYILKIHGDISRPDSCIIFKSDYEKLYRKDTLGKYQLGKIFSNKTCLFLGFSFSDPYVTTLFERISELYGGYGPQHFLLSTSNNAYDGIQTITIESHSRTEEFIDNLLELKPHILPIATKEQITENKIEPAEFQLRNIGTDTPPNVEHWVGRESELKSLEIESNFKVIFITGFGGQGKSSLAAYYSETCKTKNLYTDIDWRDFKEEEHNFDLKISSLIEKISKGSHPVSSLVGLDTELLIQKFFETIGSKSYLFVFDNVDSYIDLETFEPIGGIGKLFNCALQTPHNSKFIFTCRPFIHYAGINFFQLKLAGLTEENVTTLFLESNLPISNSAAIDVAIRAHALTDGHALWVSLILAQAKRGLVHVENFLDNIESKNIVEASESSILSRRILREIWDSLNDKQKILLRTLAESITSESEEEISKIIGSELNFNQFSKALRTLKDFHLIVTKGENNYIELHPLVKEFIKYNFPNQEQKKFISLFIRYYDQFILLLKPRLNQILTLSEFKSWSNKIELHINNSEFTDAINSLIEIHDSINRSGYTEEYVRLSCALLDKITWQKSKLDNLENFLEFFDNAITAIIEYGDTPSANDYLNKFSDTTTAKNNNYIFLISAKCHMYWYQGDFDKAIKYGEEADYLISQTGEQDKWNARHRLNLSYRDSESPENVSKSIKFFLAENNLHEITSASSYNKELSYSIYGNVGRCLHFSSQYELALNCYAKSALLIKTGLFADTNLNNGYAFKWIGEALKQLGSDDYIYFYINAYSNWKKCAPPMANNIQKLIEKIPNTTKFQSIRSLESWQIEKYCDNWCQKRTGNKVN